jgi:hypothetical protein
MDSVAAFKRGIVARSPNRVPARSPSVLIEIDCQNRAWNQANSAKKLEKHRMGMAKKGQPSDGSWRQRWQLFPWMTSR